MNIIIKKVENNELINNENYKIYENEKEKKVKIEK